MDEAKVLLAKLRAERKALFDRLIDLMASERGIDVVACVSADQQVLLGAAAEVAYNGFREHLLGGGDVDLETELEAVLARLFIIDDEVHQLQKISRTPRETLH